MSQDVLPLLRGLFANEGSDDRVHFHLGPTGQPVVCEFPHCDRPALSVER